MIHRLVMATFKEKLRKEEKKVGWRKKGFGKAFLFMSLRFFVSLPRAASRLEKKIFEKYSLDESLCHILRL